MKALVTGAAGFIGPAPSEGLLADKGWEANFHVYTVQRQREAGPALSTMLEADPASQFRMVELIRRITGRSEAGLFERA